MFTHPLVECDVRLTSWCLEKRFTKGLNVELFSSQLALPTDQLLARRLELNDPQRLGIWRRQQSLPWAVYLRIRELYGTPTFHEVPDMERRRQPVRLPLAFNRLIEARDPASAAPVAPSAPVVPATPELPTTPPAEPATVVVRLEVVGPASGELQLQRLEALVRGLDNKLEALEDRLATLQVNRPTPPARQVFPHRR